MRVLLSVLLASLALSAAAADERPSPPRPGLDFQSAETRRMQGDDGASPGMLWVEQGAALWQRPEGPAQRSCASCHQSAAVSMKGAAARYPLVDAASGSLLNIEGRINQCRKERMSAIPFAYESNELLALTAFVTHQSRGVPRTVSVEGAAKPYFEAGRAFYEARQGQLNLACGQCHNDNWGKRLRGDIISQGQTRRLACLSSRVADDWALCIGACGPAAWACGPRCSTTVRRNTWRSSCTWPGAAKVCR